VTVVICAGIRIEGRTAQVLGATMCRVGTSALNSLRRRRAELQVQLARLRGGGGTADEISLVEARLANAEAILRGRAGL